MGCGASRLGGEAATRPEEGGVVPLPAGIVPLLRRRLDEMRKRNHGSVLKGKHTMSKKELLNSSSEDGDHETEENNEGSLKLSAKVAPAPDHHVEEKKEVVVYEKVPSRDDVKEVKEEEVVKKQEDVVKEPEEKNDQDHDEAINVKKEGGDDGKNHDDEEVSMNSFDERMIGPGSPSFRVYCMDLRLDDDEEKDGEDTRKSIGTESVMTEIKEEESEDGSIAKQEKRERKGKRFGMGLPKKYLANVTARCSVAGAGCMGNTHSRLIQEKSSQ